MATSKNSIAIKAHTVLARFGAFAIAGFLCAANALADPVGTVTDLSGPLLVRKIDGTVKVLSVKSTVDSGDTLVSEKDTYARVKFIDNSEVTLRPNTQFKIENFSYDEAKPQNDNAFFSLLKGGLRSITGLLGKRNHDKFGLNTPTATIGIRGTTFVAEYIPPTGGDVAAYQAAAVAAAQTDTSAGNVTISDAPIIAAPRGVLSVNDAVSKPVWQLAQNTIPTAGGNLNPGLYVQVLDGAINVSNGGGSQNFTAGQFGYTPSFKQPPVILPENPGLQFTPPPSFSSTTGSQGGDSGAKPGDVDCQVR